jgi:hypothetical protein
MKFAADRPYGDPEKLRSQAGRDRQFGRGCAGRPNLHRTDNAPFLFEHKGSPAEYKAGLELATARGWLALHESGTYVRFMPAGAELFA